MKIERNTGEEKEEKERGRERESECDRVGERERNIKVSNTIKTGIFILM